MALADTEYPAFPRFFFFNDTATTEIYTLSLHDALPIFAAGTPCCGYYYYPDSGGGLGSEDRKSTRLNSSHSQISYAVFCWKRKKAQRAAHTGEELTIKILRFGTAPSEELGLRLP